MYIDEVTRLPREKKQRQEVITFTIDNLPDDPLPHQDELVIQLDINDAIVHQVLVEMGSSINVMYYDIFTKLSLSRSQLTQVKTPL